MLSLFGLSTLSFLNAHAEEPTARAPLPKHIIRVPDAMNFPMFDYRLTIKFRDAWQVRSLSDGSIVSKAGKDISSAQSIIGQHQLRLSALIQLPEEAIARIEQRAAAFSGNAQPDLLGMMVVNIPKDRNHQMVEIGELLQNQPEVEYAYIETIGTPPPADIGTTTPDYTSLQGYNASDPGVDMDYMYTLGITGSNVQVTDCEYGYDANHEDLVDQDITQESGQTVSSWVAAYGYDEHGTACVGEMAAGNNGYGITGLTYDAIVKFNPEYSDEEGSRRASAIASAIDGSAIGDLILLEMQTQASYISGSSLYGPAELNPNVWTVTKTGTDAGVVIVAAAGNGDQDLDASV